MSIYMTWLGHATLNIDVNGTNILVDPFLHSNPTFPRHFEVNPDFILVTHGHTDHVADLIPVAQRTDALVIANPEIAGWVRNQGVQNVHGMNTGGAFDFPFGRVKMTRAFHSSSLPDGSYGGDPGGFLLFIEDKKIYIAGDTALFSDMALIGKHDLDMAIVPIGDNYTMGPEDAATAVTDYLKPKVAIPYHFGTIPVLTGSPDVWATQVANNSTIEPVILYPGATYPV